MNSKAHVGGNPVREQILHALIWRSSFEVGSGGGRGPQVYTAASALSAGNKPIETAKTIAFQCRTANVLKFKHTTSFIFVCK
jgi:hypothetical protein